MLKCIFWSFLCCMKIQYDFFFALRDLAVCMKTKTCFFMFWRKPGILIPDLYFYDIKIQTNIKQNLVEKYVRKSQFFSEMFFWIFLWTGLDPTHLFWVAPDLSGPVNSREWINSLSIVHTEQWRRCSEEEEEEEGTGVDLRWLRGSAAGGCWPENSLDGGRPFFFFSVFFLLLCSPLFLFFCVSFSPRFCLLLLLSSSISNGGCCCWLHCWWRRS